MDADRLLAETRSASPPPAGIRPPIAPARGAGAILMASGQTAVGDNGELIARGQVGTEIGLDLARRCAWQCAVNVLTAVQAELGSLDRVESVLKMTVYVASSPTFVEQHLVADAATECLLRVLGERVGRHARAAIGVAALPTGSPVEVEAIFQVR
jgi:enamine deaminase RidA (YjgF/YER057c/UK114 family)